MSEDGTNSENTETASVLTDDDRIAAAADLLPDLGEMGGIDGFDATEGEVEEEPEPEPEQKEEPEPEQKEEPEPEPEPEQKEEPEPEPEQKEEPPGYKWQALRKAEQRFKNETESTMAELKQMQLQLEKDRREIDDLARMAKYDPEGYFNEVAKRGGYDPNDVYERMTRRRVNEGKPDSDELFSMMQRIEQRLDERDAERKRQAEAASEAEQQAQYTRGVNILMGQAMDGKIHMEDGTIADLADIAPTVARMHPRTKAARVNELIHWGIARHPDATFPQLLKSLEKVVAEEYDHFQQSQVAARGQDTPASETPEPEGQRTPAHSANSAAEEPVRTTIVNTDEAVPSAKTREMTHEERIAAAARALPDLSGFEE